ncbi:MAG TPA: DUF1553 domain-containing protein [Verrucomicrobiae bacterium]|nr:DUF1553 domain-containing protein [Verrucomicrobiae bacterium]
MRVSLMAAAMMTVLAVAAAAKEPVRPFELGQVAAPGCKIDELVFTRLRQLGIQPANLCSDNVFVRRVFLDVIGTLPTPKEASDFLQDTRPDKRAALIDQLLGREEFADYWSLKWADLLRVKAEFPINLWPNAVQGYHRWIRTAIKDNAPYDQFVRELLTASGSNFRNPQVNFYRALQSKEPKAIAQAVALTFMGERADKWPAERLNGMAAFFAQIGYKSTQEWKEEVVFFDPSKVAPGAPAARLGTPVFPDGTAAKVPPDVDPREVFADWLVTPKNPWFARNMVNRAWAWLFGRGIIHEPDDIRPDNPPSNPELLAWLEGELVAAKFDMKHIFRLILNSRVYQLSSIRPSERPEAEANFAFYPMRRLDAEVLIDALCQITGTTEEYSSPIPEPFTFIPDGQRSIALADGSVTSPFLEMFGRPSRDTGVESERNNRPTAAQGLHLLNSSHVRQKIERGEKLRNLIWSSGSPEEAVTRVYMAILSRQPTAQEMRGVREYFESGKVSRQEAYVDLAWALINSAEFLFRH